MSDRVRGASGERVRGANGAWRRYKGDRELIGARVPPQVTDRVDDRRCELGLSRNDYIFAALLVAMDNPDLVADAADSLDEMLTGRRTHPEARQLCFADGDQTAREVLAEPA